MYLLFQVDVASQDQQHVMIDSSVFMQLHFPSLTLQDTTLVVRCWPQRVQSVSHCVSLITQVFGCSFR